MNSLWIRRIALGLLALLVLLGVAAAALVASFDANRFKGLAIDWMKTERQRTLAIDGPIELSLFPRLAVKVSKLRLSERGRAQEFAAIDEAALSVQVWPLLRKQLVVDRVSARGVRAVYSRNAQGVSNIDDLLAPAPTTGSAGASAPASGAPSLRLDVSAVSLEDVQLRLRDDFAKRAGLVTLEQFSSGRLASGVQTPVTLRASVDLTQPEAIKLALDGSASVAFDFDSKALTANKLKLQAKGDAAGVKGLVLTLGLDKLVHDPAARRLQLESLALALVGQPGGHALEIELDWPQLSINGERLSGSALSGRFKRGGPTAIAGNFRSEAPSGNFDAVRLPGLAFTLTGNAGPRKIEGKAKADLLLRIAKAAFAVERLELSTTLTQAGSPPLQLALRGNASGDAKAALWQVDGSLNSNRFESSGSAGFGAAVPTVKASARFDSLDLNALTGSGPAAATPAAPADDRIALDGLRAVNGQFTLSAKSLAVRQFRIADAQLEALLDNGLLRIPRLSGSAWGGRLDGSGSADARNQRIAVKLAASGVDVNAMLKEVAGKDLLEGRGRVNADINTSGATVGALRSNLAGTAALQLRDGAIKGINLARTMRQAKAALSGRQDAVSKARESEKTDFSELNMSARVAGGVAESDDLELKSPYLRIGGAGRFDVGRGRIDYTARATVVAAPAGQDGSELAALRGVTVPVLLSGPFDAIDWKVQWSGVAAAAIENKLKDKLAEKLGAKLGVVPAPGSAASSPAAPTNAKDQLKERLKGLFK